MHKPSWIRTHRPKKRLTRELPDYARFPSVHPAGIDPCELEELKQLRDLRDSLSTPQYRRIQSGRRHQK